MVTAVRRDQFASQIFNYVPEVAIAPVNQYGAPQIKLIADINSVPGIDGGESYFQGGSYKWTDKDGYSVEATSVKGILSECGFDPV